MKKNMYRMATFLLLFFTNFSCPKADTFWQRGKKWVSNPFEYIRSQEKVIVDNPYAQTVAHVRIGNELHPTEREYLAKRKLKIKTCLEKILKTSLQEKQVPNISLICSGGGCRAMLGSIGAFSGLQTLGLLDSILYISGLSGSTWALGLWMSTGMSIKKLKQYVGKQLTNDFYRIRRPDSRLAAHMILVKAAFHQPFSTIDLFGAFLARHFLKDFFGDTCQMVHMTDQIKIMEKQQLPFPIYTAIDARIGLEDVPWYEFTPIEIGSAHYGLYIPSWAYGRLFKDGISSDFAPEQSLGFHFGVFGSAYGAHFKAAWDRVLKDLVWSQAKSIIEKTILVSRAASFRVAWADVNNFMIGMDTQDPLRQDKILKLVDAGVECNLPYSPLSGKRTERKQDILIILDFSEKIPDELKIAEDYARINNLKFPVINYRDIEKKTISIFKDADPEVPVVIYMPRVTDQQLLRQKRKEAKYRKYRVLRDFDFGKCVQSGPGYTTNFNYSSCQSRQIMDQMEFNIIVNKDKIIEVIKGVVERK